VPWDLPRRFKQRAARALLDREWSLYPDFHGHRLRRAIGEREGHPWDGVLLGNGSSELLAVALSTLTERGGEVLTLLPGFGLYSALIEDAGAVPCLLGPTPELRLPLEELEREIERNPRRPVLLCSPNNPTGEAVPVERVAAIAERLEAPLLLDNAYGEFTAEDYRPLLARFPHLLIFGTFSKAWSLAGMRLGYLLADPALVAELIKVKLPYNLGHAALAAGEAALAAAPWVERTVRLLIGRREQWARMLAERGLEVFPSEANFLLVRCPGGDRQARRLLEGLARRGILVRDMTGPPGMSGCLRLSVGSGPALRATAAALDEIADEPASDSAAEASNDVPTAVAAEETTP
jgi:histidinol-phosphate aminotransferase